MPYFHRYLNATIKDKEAEHVLGSNNGAAGFPPRLSSYSCIQMNGQEVFRFAVRCVPQSIEASLEKAGLTSSSIDWLLLHQVRVCPQMNPDVYGIHCRVETN